MNKQKKSLVQLLVNFKNIWYNKGGDRSLNFVLPLLTNSKEELKMEKLIEELLEEMEVEETLGNEILHIIEHAKEEQA